MNNLLDKLGKNDSGIDASPTESAKKLNDVKRRLQYIYKPLKLEAGKYKPELSVTSIGLYIKDNPIQRILYSEISSFIVGLNENERATVSTNLDTLVSHVLDNAVSPDIQKISIKLYDHFQLNLIQLENAKAASDKAIAESIVEEKEKLHQEVKGIEKEYITILGIFAAIMLAFVGSFTFSTSVLNNIAKTDVYSIALIALVIGLVFLILITVLIDFLRDINDKVVKDEKGKRKINVVSKCAIILLSVLIIITMLGSVLVKIELPEKVYIGSYAESSSPADTLEPNEQNE